MAWWNFWKKQEPKSAFYDGGRFTKANRDFWNANSDFETTASPDRDTLRARARWLNANNPIVSNIDVAIADYSIGNDLQFQLKTENEKLNKEVELAWKFAKENLDITGRDDFDTMCRVALMQRFMDGECLFYLPTIKEFGLPSLKIQPIEVDRFALGSFNLEGGMFFDGVQTDKFGKPTFYHIQNDLFQQALVANKQIQNTTALPAQNVLNYFRRENRFTQYRGISEYKQIITDLKNFAAYMRATVESARSRANIAYVVSKENPDNRNFQKDVSGDPVKEINNIFVKHLRPNEKIEILDPNNTGDTYKDFVSSVVRLISTGRKVSYELAFRDYSNVNYSSARMSLLQDYKIFNAEFSHFTKYFYMPIFMRWLEVECMKGAFTNLTYSQFLSQKPLIKNSVKIYPPRKDWVDPYKDANGDAIMLENCTTTLRDILGEKGKDWEEELEQRAKEIKKMEALGIPTDKVAPINREIKDE